MLGLLVVLLYFGMGVYTHVASVCSCILHLPVLQMHQQNVLSTYFKGHLLFSIPAPYFYSWTLLALHKMQFTLYAAHEVIRLSSDWLPATNGGFEQQVGGASVSHRSNT